MKKIIIIISLFALFNIAFCEKPSNIEILLSKRLTLNKQEKIELTSKTLLIGSGIALIPVTGGLSFIASGIMYIIAEYTVFDNEPKHIKHKRKPAKCN